MDGRTGKDDTDLSPEDGLAASKTCACGVRFRSAAPVVGSDTLCGCIGDGTGFRYGE